MLVVALNFNLLQTLLQFPNLLVRQAKVVVILQLELNVQLLVHEFVAKFVAFGNVTRLGFFAIFFRRKLFATLQFGKLTYDNLRILLPRRLVENFSVNFRRSRFRHFDDLHCLVEFKAQSQFRRQKLIELFAVGMSRPNSFHVDYSDAARFGRLLDFFCDRFFGHFGCIVKQEPAAD